MKCVNCDKDALFEYRLTEEKSLVYCNSHLPKFLNDMKKAGSLAITPAFETFAQEAAEVLTTTSSDVPEEPAQAKKAPKKKAE